MFIPLLLCMAGSERWDLGKLTELLSNTSEETNQIEFKREWVRSEKIEQTICAMANAEGGLILVGVTDSREVVGIDDFGEVNHKVSQLIANCIQPPRVEGEKIPLENGKVVLVLKVFSSEDKPVQSANGAFYYRTQGRNQFIPRPSLMDVFVLRDIRNVRKTRLTSVITQSIVAIEEETAPGGALKNGNRSIVFEKLLLKEIMDGMHDYPYFMGDHIDQSNVSRIFHICNKFLQMQREFEVERDVLLKQRWGQTYVAGDGFINELQNKTRFIRDSMVSELIGLKSELGKLLSQLVE